MKYRVIVAMAAILWAGLAYSRHFHINKSIFDAVRAPGAGELRLSEAADFDWDHVYLFPPYMPRERVCATRGIDTVVCKAAVRFESRTDNDMSLAFVRDGRLVRYHYHSRADADFTPLPRRQPVARRDAVFRIDPDDRVLNNRRWYRLVQWPLPVAGAG